MAAAEEKNVRDAPARAVKKLEAAIGKDNVKTSKMERLLYSHEGSAPLPNIAQLGFMNVPEIVARPTSTADVQKIVQIANEEGVPIVPRGASSWGMGGSMPIFGGIIVDMTGKMNKIIEIDPAVVWSSTTRTSVSGCRASSASRSTASAARKSASTLTARSAPSTPCCLEDP